MVGGRRYPGEGDQLTEDGDADSEEERVLASSHGEDV